MKTLASIALLFAFAALPLSGAPTLKPQYALKASALVTDILVDKNRLYAATEKGGVEIFDITLKKQVEKITLPGVKDFMGDTGAPKIYDIDRMGEKLIMVSEGVAGFRDVYLHDSSALTKVIDASQKFFIRRAAFVDEKRILLGLLSCEIVLYDIESRRIIYKHPVKKGSSGGSAFGDMALSEDRTKVAVADESGEVHLFAVKDFSLIRVFKGQNLDNIYKIDYKKGVLITAGQDRRCAVYRPDGSAYYMPGSFLIYGAALSPSGKTGVFAEGIENELLVFSILTKTKTALLKGHNATLNGFAFLNEKEFFSSAEEQNILFWSLK